MSDNEDTPKVAARVVGTVQSAAGEAAVTVAGWYKGLGIEREDLEQEAWVWVCAHAEKVNDWLCREDPAEFRSGRGALVVTLRRELAKYAEREKAEREGYDVSDQHRYTRTQVAKLLPGLLCDAFAGFESFDDTGGKVSGGSDPAEGGNVLVHRMDVRRAWTGNRILIDLYGPNAYGREELAERLGVSERTLARRERRALDGIVSRLNRYDVQPDGLRHVPPTVPQHQHPPALPTVSDRVPA